MPALLVTLPQQLAYFIMNTLTINLFFLILFTSNVSVCNTYTNKALSIKLTLVGMDWNIESDVNSVSGGNGLTLLYILRDRVQDANGEVKRIFREIRDMFEVVTCLSDVVCINNYNGFDKACYMKACGLSDDRSWTFPGEVLVFSVRKGFNCLSGYFFSAEPFYGERNVVKMFSSFSSL